MPRIDTLEKSAMYNKTDVQKKFEVIYINMDSDTDRRAAIETALNSRNVKFERISGIAPDNIPKEIRSRFEAKAIQKSALSPGEVGCCASHLSIASKITMGELSAPLLVLEDDVIIPPRIVEIVDMILRSAPADWDMIKLYGVMKRPAIKLISLEGFNFDLVAYSRPPVGTVAYLLSSHGAKKMMDLGKVDAPIDVMLARQWRHNMNIYGIEPPPIQLAPFASTIDATSPTSSRGHRNRRWSCIFDARRLTAPVRKFGVRGCLAIIFANLTYSLARKAGVTSKRTVVLELSRIKL